jgi:hypothetical protein
MIDKIVRFPSTTAEQRVERIRPYRSTSRAETLIAAWLCGWALISAAECIRQISRAPLPATPPAQVSGGQTYVAAMYPIASSGPSASPTPRETCNFSRPNRVLWLN